MTEPHSPDRSTPAVDSTPPDVDDNPTAVLPVAEDRSGDQPTALQTKDTELSDDHQEGDAPSGSADSAASDSPRRRRRAQSTAFNWFGWQTQAVVMVAIYVAAIVIGVLLGLWITNSMDTIPGVN